jgi:hypothetical protein
MEKQMKLKNFSKILLLTTLLLVVACGKKGPPVPPETFAPSPVKYLVVSGKPNAIVINWEAPNTNASADLLDDLSGFEIKKAKVFDKLQPRFRKLVKIPLGDVIAGEQKKFTYSDTDVAAGDTYEYFISAYNLDGTQGATNWIKVIFRGQSSIISVQ